MNPAEALEVLEKKGAIARGHFRLSSGRHSDVFVQKFRVFEDPGLTQRFGESIAESFPEGYDTVASPAVGAIVLGFSTALASHARFAVAERVEGQMTFRRGYELSSHERVLVVEDVITTGGSAKEMGDLVRACGGDPIGVGALIDRGDPARLSEFGVPVRSLLTLTVPSWPEDVCPLCKANQPVDDPGSRRLKP